MNKKNYYAKKILKELDDAMEFKRSNIQAEISRRAGFKVPKPTKVQTQRYLASELNSSKMVFNIKAWEKAVAKKIKNDK